MFSKEYKAYLEKGLTPLPIKPGAKRPIVSKWATYCRTQPDDKTIKSWVDKYPDYGVGICLGTMVTDRLQLVAIDIDEDSMQEPVEKALGNYPVAKVGKKGITFFVLADSELKNKKIKKDKTTPAIEILCNGSQTVIPPTIHPDTNAPYTWIGEDLRYYQMTDLPILTPTVIDEITAWCTGKGRMFEELNTMLWRGEGGGGNTHDTCVSAVAFLVSRGWDDQDIFERINRAKKEAVERNGESYNWPDAKTRISEWIASARDKGMTNSSEKKGNRQIPMERVMADWAIDRSGGFEYVATCRGQLRRYKDGYWPEVDVAKLLRAMYNVEPTLREREAKAAVSIVHTLTTDRDFGRTPGIEPKNDPKRQKICLQNGTLNLKTGDLEQWNHEDQLLHKLDFEWDDTAECPTYDKVIQQTFNDDKDSINLWDEYCAHTLVDDMTFQKLLFLKGPGGNGKGTLARVLQSMHDPNAVGSVGITDLNDERKRTSLVGKLVNISGEQSRLNLVADTYLKKITGGDPVDVRKLYGETENNIQLSVRFIELVNEMPTTNDNSHALRRRIIILETPNKVDNPDSNLDYKLYKERPGILRRWVAALERLYKRGKFNVPAISEREVEQYMMENDPVRYWVHSKMRRCQEDEHGTPSSDLYLDFKEWYDLMGWKSAYPEVSWGKRMNALGYPVKVRKVGRKSVRIRDLVPDEGVDF